MTQLMDMDIFANFACMTYTVRKCEKNVINALIGAVRKIILLCNSVLDCYLLLFFAPTIFR